MSESQEQNGASSGAGAKNKETAGLGVVFLGLGVTLLLTMDSLAIGLPFLALGLVFIVMGISAAKKAKGAAGPDGTDRGGPPTAS
jgi:hypothetical protein